MRWPVRARDEIGNSQEEDANERKRLVEFSDWGKVVGQMVFPDPEEGEDSKDRRHPQHANQLLLYTWFAVVEDVTQGQEEVDHTCND